MKTNRWIQTGLVVLFLLVSLLSGCGGTTVPTAAPTQPPKPTSPPATATPVPPTPTPKGPTVGGVLRYALRAEIDSLDPQKTSDGMGLWELGGALLTKDLKTGEYLPYLAESWSASPDGMTWTLKLKKGVKFHDGTPVTAKDWVYTFKRAKSGDTKSPVTSSLLMSVVGSEAPDDYTLVVKMANPDFYITESFADGLFMSPLSQAAVEKWGDQYGRHPVSVGPFKFKEWITGEKIVLERNPDFAWGPPYTRGGPTYISTLEFLILPEAATRIAALEAGELDVALVEAQDLPRVQATGRFQTYDWVFSGVSPCVEMNTEKPPLNDVRVRQALSLAVDREALIKAVALGQATVQYGPISSSVKGYWPGIEKIGYGFDLPRAKELMKQAGYVAGTDGMLQKDGQSLAISLLAASYNEAWVKIGQMLKEQYKALGITMNLTSQGDVASTTAALRSGQYEMAVNGWGNTSARLMGGMFYSAFINVLNDARVNDPVLDKMLMGYIYTGDTNANSQGAIDVQKYIVENAYIIPLYSPKRSVVVSNRVKGTTRGSYQGHVEFYDAYIAD